MVSSKTREDLIAGILSDGAELEVVFDGRRALEIAWEDFTSFHPEGAANVRYVQNYAPFLEELVHNRHMRSYGVWLDELEGLTLEELEELDSILDTLCHEGELDPGLTLDLILEEKMRVIEEELPDILDPDNPSRASEWLAHKVLDTDFVEYDVTYVSEIGFVNVSPSVLDEYRTSIMV